MTELAKAHRDLLELLDQDGCIEYDARSNTYYVRPKHGAIQEVATPALFALKLAGYHDGLHITTAGRNALEQARKRRCQMTCKLTPEELDLLRKLEQNGQVLVGTRAILVHWPNSAIADVQLDIVTFLHGLGLLQLFEMPKMAPGLRMYTIADAGRAALAEQGGAR